MGRLVGTGKAEDIILDYLDKQTNVDFKKFNPSQLTNHAIARNTDLDMDIVDETLETLSNGAIRVEKAQCNFEFWLPATKEAEKIKKRLFESNLAFSNVALFSFISVVILFYVLKLAVIQKLVNLVSTSDYFFSGVIITAFSIYIAKKITNKYYFMSQRIREVKHYKIYMWSFIIFTSILVYAFNKNWETNFLIQRGVICVSLIANFVTIVGFFINLIKKK